MHETNKLNSKANRPNETRVICEESSVYTPNSRKTNLNNNERFDS